MDMVLQDDVLLKSFQIKLLYSMYLLLSMNGSRTPFQLRMTTDFSI